MGDVRIIPARAGFTRRSSPRGRGGRDHPRSRGVYTKKIEYALNRIGSSPLARGLQRVRVGGELPDRIIPARAGFTSRGDGHEGPRRDHPRSRGVYRWGRSAHGDLSGSSPLARGLRIDLVPTLLEVGIIPARAGFTEVYGRVRGSARDHPRSRGVYVTNQLLSDAPAGSSPLARGLRREGRRDRHGGRIIPARAGFMTCSPLSR